MREALSVGLIGLLCLGGFGCGKSEPGPAVVKVRPSMAVQPLSAPLTATEVETFLAVVKSLPGGQPPEPAPPTPLRVPPGHPPRECLTLWRAHIREQLDPQQMAGNWKHGGRVHEILAEHEVDPTAFASLMSRISAAWVSRSLEGGGTDLDKESRSADNRMEIAVRQIEEIDRRSQGLAEVPGQWVARREALLENLQELVSLSEFLRLMKSVPPESRQVLEARRSDLVALLPSVNGDTPFERRDDRRVIPTGFEFEE